MHKALTILSPSEFGYLLYLIDALPYAEAQALAAELKETYSECLDKHQELQLLAERIRETYAQSA